VEKLFRREIRTVARQTGLHFSGTLMGREYTCVIIHQASNSIARDQTHVHDSTERFNLIAEDVICRGTSIRTAYLCLANTKDWLAACAPVGVGEGLVGEQ